jgi:hypothetical protein
MSESSKPKIGAGHFSAMGRLGLRELRNSLNPSRESIADTEMGLYGTRTPGEVAEMRQPEPRSLDKEEERPAISIEHSR